MTVARIHKEIGLGSGINAGTEETMPYQSDTALPGDMHRFFAMQQLVEQYGAGQIPTEEWEALNAWNSES